MGACDFFHVPVWQPVTGWSHVYALFINFVVRVKFGMGVTLVLTWQLSCCFFLKETII